MSRSIRSNALPMAGSAFLPLSRQIHLCRGGSTTSRNRISPFATSSRIATHGRNDRAKPEITACFSRIGAIDFMHHPHGRSHLPGHLLDKLADRFALAW